MQEEIFSIVDESGKIIGSATRNHCHDGSMLLHPVIHLHIFDLEGNIYLQKRSNKKDIFPDKWDSAVGGHIDIGETPEEAVIREAQEELGLMNLNVRYITKHIIETEFERELTYCFYAITEHEPRPDMIEVSDGRYWSLDEIKLNLGKGVFTPNFEFDFMSFLSEGVDQFIS